MNIRKKMIYLVLFSVALTALNATEITGRGASFPAKVYQEWCTAYNKETDNNITYVSTGSGDGILSIKNRKIDFGGSDKPLQPWRLKRYKLSMFPTIIGSIILAYNIPGVADNELMLSEEAIGDIFSAKAKYWDDPVITANNKHLTLPHKLIKVAVRSDGSGTTYNFVYYLRKIDYKHFRKATKKFKWKANTIAAEGNGGVTQLIKNNEYSIGYIGYAYKEKFKMTAATIENKSGQWVTANIASCQDGARYAKLDKKRDFYAMIAYPDGDSSYPIIATSFVLLANENHQENKDIVHFYDWVFKNGAKIAEKYGYVSLPNKTIKEIKSYWKSKAI